MQGPAPYHDAPDILIVDDTPDNVQLLGGLLKAQGYKIRVALSGRLALQAAQHAAPDLVLLDISMPGMDGYEVCGHLKKDEILRNVPVVFISAMNEPVDKVKAFGAGGVDYITKPFNAEEVKARVQTHLRLRALQGELEKYNRHLQDLVQAQVKEIADSQMATIFALAKLAESRDEGTGAHLERVQVFCRMLAARLGELPKYRAVINASYIDNIFHASPLHDIGKVAIPDRILQKHGELSPEEFAVMKSHTAQGVATLEAVQKQYPRNDFITVGIEIAKAHHERWDGLGYPSGLEGEAIPLCARIMAVADCYDALRSKRVYKEPFSHAKSRDFIAGESGKRFDPDVVRAFLDIEPAFREIRDRMAD
jgi:putative two-component system response regulator